MKHKLVSIIISAIMAATTNGNVPATTNESIPATNGNPAEPSITITEIEVVDTENISIATTVSVDNSGIIVEPDCPRKTRTAAGTYYDYMCIVTDDGNEWLLSDAQSKANPYMYYESEIGMFMPRFSPDQRVTVTFATNGTIQLEDDEIINVF